MTERAELVRRVSAFQVEAHGLLGRHESAGQSRVFMLDNAYERLDALNLRQDELFRQALRCIEEGLHRAAHVLAWAGFMDYLEQRLAADQLQRVHAVRPKWSRWATIEELRENVPEAQLIEVAREVKLCTKGQGKVLSGLLSTRNECAHPSDYSPGLNEALGYVEQLLKRVTALDASKTPT